MSDTELRREVEQLRAEIDRVDDWANGVFAVVQDLTLLLLRTHPELLAELEPPWREAAENYDKVKAGQKIPADEAEQLEQLEARKILYRMAEQLQLWPKRGGR